MGCGPSKPIISQSTTKIKVGHLPHSNRRYWHKESNRQHSTATWQDLCWNALLSSTKRERWMEAFEIGIQWRPPRSWEKSTLTNSRRTGQPLCERSKMSFITWNLVGPADPVAVIAGKDCTDKQDDTGRKQKAWKSDIQEALARYYCQGRTVDEITKLLWREWGMTANQEESYTMIQSMKMKGKIIYDDESGHFQINPRS